MAQLQAQQAEHKAWKLAFMVLGAFVIIIMPALSHSYGQSGDEWLQLIYGHDIWNYFTHGDQQALDYSQKSLQFQKQELYGGFFDFLTDVFHEWFPSVRIYILRHFFNALTGALTMVYTGLLAWRLSRKWSVGFIALLFIFLSPRIFGESMNNPKDIPFACGFVMAIYYFLALVQDFPAKRWLHVIGLCIGFGIAFGVRAAGGILELAYFVLFFALYFYLEKDFKAAMKADSNKLMKQLLLSLAIAIVGGYIVGLLCWPWGLQSPIGHPLESLKGMTNRETVIRVLFEGDYHMNFNMPWYYEFKWLLISNPVIVVLGVLLFLVLIMNGRKQYGLFAIIFVLFCSFFPLVYMIYKKSSVYDTWRHVFFVYPFWVIMAALGIDLVGEYIKNEKLKWLPKGIAAAALIPVIMWMFNSHPNEYIYFNEFVGGVKGAVGNYDLDYYQNTSLQAAQWIINNAPKPAPGQKIEVASNMNGFDNYFARDTSWIGSSYGRYTERDHKNWDYYIVNPRFLPVEVLLENKWVPANAAHVISVNGVPICAILKRAGKLDIPAYDSFSKKDYAGAAQLYSNVVKTDSSNSTIMFYYGVSLASIGQVDAGIAALKKAVDLDPSNAQYYDILSKVYQAKGDQTNAQTAMSRAREIATKEQEQNEKDQEAQQAREGAQ